MINAELKLSKTKLNDKIKYNEKETIQNKKLKKNSRFRMYECTMSLPIKSQI